MYTESVVDSVLLGLGLIVQFCWIFVRNYFLRFIKMHVLDFFFNFLFHKD